MMALLPGNRLPRAFYDRPTAAVARALLGQRLVRSTEDGLRLGGRICETEAYGGPDDEASHAYRRTPRSAIMYGAPGHAYVYFIYGMYFCLNAVTESDGAAGAVLIRGVLLDEGIALARARRHGAAERRLADGPGKLCRALDITTALNGVDLVTSTALLIEADADAPDAQVKSTPRIGVRGSAEARLRPWRFVWQPAP